MRFYVNRIVLIAQQKPISRLYGIPVICVNNGIDFDSISLRKTVMSLKEKDGIHILCVSGCFFWHGYDRIIEGLHLYYEQAEGREKVYLHIVGDGECLEDYRALAAKYNLLDKTVYLHGRKVGEALDAMYDVCDIALDSLGAHRKGIHMSSSLKTREYAAKGLPMVTSTRLDIQNEKTDEYILMLPESDEAVDIRAVVDFYHTIYDQKDKAIVAKEIRNCFYPYCDWEFVFQGVVDYLV